MRALGAIAGCAFGLAFAADACAADLSVRGGSGYGYGVPAGQIVIWDSEPGVVTRAYWLPPWRNRHYFPSNGSRPEIGRDEDLSKRYRPTPARGYRRHWSASSGYGWEYPRGGVFPFAPEPLEPSLK